MKKRYGQLNVRQLKAGSGGMYKFIVELPESYPILIKKHNFFSELWLSLNGVYKIAAPYTQKHRNFNDIANVLEFILNSNLKQHTFLISVDREKKEYWQEYSVDSMSELDYSTPSIIDNIEKIMEEFKDEGLQSLDHSIRNFLVLDDKLYLVDLEELYLLDTKSTK